MATKKKIKIKPDPIVENDDEESTVEEITLAVGETTNVDGISILRRAKHGNAAFSATLNRRTGYGSDIDTAIADLHK